MRLLVLDDNPLLEWTVVRLCPPGTELAIARSFEEARRLDDRVVIVGGGRVSAQGTRKEIAGERGLEETYFALTRGTPLAEEETP